ncbi:nucleoside/nucleotide kinase family protein [Arsenicicoccus sp. oral taxon 190]|uniref:nucleoside/nucleotide kinase family protein n=1 Tax=Arsenicicoccus sp. oral taxon 190 TaxID=1658671 RepID=UPI0009E1DD84|nr:nucleoside/nucleotide kinase family protein [Arsenicicoccus sp. oral taxon 190]
MTTATLSQLVETLIEGLGGPGSGERGPGERGPDGGRRLVLGITGPPGAGKTTLALALLDALRARHGEGFAAHLPMDGFHLADAQLDRLGLRERKGAPETFDRDGYAATLARVSTADGDVYVPGFERELEQPLAAALVVQAAARVVVSEGNYLLLPGWEQARAACDEVWWVELDDAVRRERLVARHTAFGKAAAAARAWVDEVDEVNAELIRATRSRADRVIRETPDGWVLS